MLDALVYESRAGDRVGRVRDPQGHVWWIQSRVEEVGPEEMEKRAGTGHAGTGDIG